MTQVKLKSRCINHYKLSGCHDFEYTLFIEKQRNITEPHESNKSIPYYQQKVEADELTEQQKEIIKKYCRKQG